ncbi:MAG TPA: amidohydrolase family protein [Pirellulales bacterium]|nr:amidohydrolase family protein [Pirellulales bacterium]
MPEFRYDPQRIDRRRFVKASLISAALPIGAAVACREGRGAEPLPATPEIPDIVDTNVHLFEWPFRRLKYGRTDALIAKLRKHRITTAWAGSFEAVLQKQLDLVNRRLADECQAHGDGMLVPIGSVNPAWPGWAADLEECHERHRMPGVRLYPMYHGYGLDHPEFARLLAEAARRKMLVQIVLRLEDERVHHPAVMVEAVDVSPLVGLLKNLPEAKVQLIDSAGPLLGKNVAALVKETTVTFDIAATEGNGGVGRLIEGTNYSYRGAIPAERLLFGSHAPYFPCENALLKLFESPLGLQRLRLLMNANARRLMGSPS